MKGMLVHTVAGILLAIICTTALAETIEQEPFDRDVSIVKPAKRPGFIGRFFNGAKNIVTAPLDIPCTIVRHASESENPLLCLFTGTAEGLVNGTVRAVAGATELVTSPIPMKRYLLYERDLGERCIREKPEF
ncbi:MAG TPA: hypothetical protein VM223_13140 [Planctomycetota bacterium]|nr:hypothetical protein [Planctomycetota bacterium]